MGNIITHNSCNTNGETRAYLLEHFWSKIQANRWDRLVLAGTSTPPPSGALHPDRTRIFLILSGCRHVQLARNRQVKDEYLYPGDILFCASGSWHAVVHDKRHVVMSLIFDKEYTALTWKVRGRGDEKILRFFAPPEHSPTTRHMIAALESMTPETYDSIAGLHLMQALVRVAAVEFEKAGELSGLSQTKMNAICDFIEENYNQALDRRMIAEEFDLHPNHISRMFTQLKGETFSQYLTRIRLAEADRLLKITNRTVKEIALNCGFSNDNYFNKVYRHNRGISPARSRQKLCNI
jgi:AraC-like DNA-binding protein